jgi:NAD(P)-dependent dehydrogenase (short-subunit alcohol dehydrogenase family)
LNSLDMAGRVCIVTGSNSGIGKETALGLAGLGATVVMVVRDRHRGETARNEIVAHGRKGDVRLEVCDLLSMDATRGFVKRFRSNYTRLDVLVNNAGAVFSNRQTTAEGFERTLALDYLAPVLVTRGLAPLMISSAPSRVVNVGSGEHSRGRIDFGDLQMAKHYGSRQAYSNAKLMLTMFTYEFARRFAATGVTANVVQPGFVATNLGRSSGSGLLSVSFWLMRPFQISAKRAAETVVYLASSDEVKSATGKCFSKLKEVTTSQASHDEEMQKRLWDTTSALLTLQ